METTPRGDRHDRLGRAILEHLRAELVSAQGLMKLAEQQQQAIRDHDVDSVVRHVQEIRAEAAHREHEAHERHALLEGADRLPPEVCREADALHAEIRLALDRFDAAAKANRVLLRRELAFLDSLLELAGKRPEASAHPIGERPMDPAEPPRSPVFHHTLNPHPSPHPHPQT